jgi:hypothetical protein
MLRSSHRSKLTVCSAREVVFVKDVSRPRQISHRVSAWEFDSLINPSSRSVSESDLLLREGETLALNLSQGTSHHTRKSLFGNHWHGSLTQKPRALATIPTVPDYLYPLMNSSPMTKVQFDSSGNGGGLELGADNGLHHGVAWHYEGTGHRQHATYCGKKRRKVMTCWVISSRWPITSPM